MPGDGSDFDARAMYRAMDAQRLARGLSWRQVVAQMSEQSAELNRRRPGDHPLSPTTLTGITRRGDTSCQHALFVLRWLGLAPEHFVPAVTSDPAPLADPGPDRRLRWSLAALHEAVDARRHEQGLTWRALARELRCGESQVRGLATVRYAISMVLTMRIVRWLGRPASDFIVAATW